MSISPHLVDVLKQAERFDIRKAEDEVDALYAKHLGVVGKAVNRTFDYMAERPEMKDLLDRWRSGDFKDWDLRLTRAAKAIRVNPRRLAESLSDTFLDGTKVAPKVLSVGDGWASADVTPQAVRYASSRAGLLVTDISETMRSNIHRYVLQTVQGDMSQDELRQTLGWVVKLDARQSAAVERYRESLLKGGMSKRKANAEARLYSQRLQAQRGERIARTETMTAINAGLKEYWMAQVAKGNVPSDAVRWRWVAYQDDRTCPVCMPMDGITVPYGDSFTTKAGVVPHPPAHPNCRCKVTVEMDGLGHVLNTLSPS